MPDVATINKDTGVTTQTEFHPQPRMEIESIRDVYLIGIVIIANDYFLGTIGPKLITAAREYIGSKMGASKGESEDSAQRRTINKRTSDYETESLR